MRPSSFVLGQLLDLEESMVLEFKEVKGAPPVQAIGRVIDEYVVAFLNAKGGSIYWGIRGHDRCVVGVQLTDAKRDELRQVAGHKIAAIAPPVAPDFYDMPFHAVVDSPAGVAVKDTFVVEVWVRPASGGGLYLTGGGEAYRKTLGGKQKLTGGELLTALLEQLQQKLTGATGHETPDGPDLSWMPSVSRRARVVRPLLRGARVLWVDDNPGNNLCERTVLVSLGISIDLAMSTEEALYMVDRLRYDLILSDMNRAGNSAAGKELLDALLRRVIAVPLVYYVGTVERSLGRPRGAFAITNRPNELLHYVFDVLERRYEVAG